MDLKRNEEEIAALAAELKRLRQAKGIRAFRSRLSREDAQAVISHSSISAVERGAISLCLRFADDQPRPPRDRWWPDAEIIDAEPP